MFGFLTASLEGLSEEQLARYRSCYCGLCRSLKRRHGQLSRLTLNYDMTFLVLLLGSLYEPEEEKGEDTCPRHPFEARSFCLSEISDYAADMNVALAYLKCLDNWDDEGSLVSLGGARLLKSAYESVCLAYPRQCAAMADSVAALRELEKQRLESPDEAAACFGALMRELFVIREDRWSDTLRSMADALGRAVYLMDACIDLDADAARDRYNPFRRFYGAKGNESRFRDILKMQLGECVFWLDRLPLVQDAGLLNNILCTGLWARFEKKYGGKDS